MLKSLKPGTRHRRGPGGAEEWDGRRKERRLLREVTRAPGLPFAQGVGSATGCSFLLSYLALTFCSRSQLPFPGKFGRGVRAPLVSPENGV